MVVRKEKVENNHRKDFAACAAVPLFDLKGIDAYNNINNNTKPKDVCESSALLLEVHWSGSIRFGVDSRAELAQIAAAKLLMQLLQSPLLTLLIEK